MSVVLAPDRYDTGFTLPERRRIAARSAWWGGQDVESVALGDVRVSWRLLTGASVRALVSLTSSANPQVNDIELFYWRKEWELYWWRDDYTLKDPATGRYHHDHPDKAITAAGRILRLAVTVSRLGGEIIGYGARTG